MEDNNLVNDFKGKCTIPSQFEYAYLSNANGLWFFFYSYDKIYARQQLLCFSGTARVANV